MAALGMLAKSRVAANLIFVGVVVLGFGMVSHLREEVFPSLPPNAITVDTRARGISAQEVESIITVKIEQALEPIAGIDSVEAVSTSEASRIRVTASRGTQIEQLHRELQSAINAIPQWPKEADPPVVQVESDRGRAIFVEVQKTELITTEQWHQIARDLRQQLVVHDDISRVDMHGIPTRDWLVEIDEYALEQHQLTMPVIEQAIRQALLRSSGGTLRLGDSMLQLRSSFDQLDVGLIESVALPGDTYVGTPRRIGDIAKVRLAYGATAPSLLRFNGKDSITIEVMTQGEERISDVVAATRAVVAASDLSGAAITLWHDESTLITSRLSALFKSGLLGFAIVLMMLALLLSRRVAWTTALGIPFSLGGAFLCMPFLGISLNSLSTFGFIIVMGILVDDAVVVGESIQRFGRKSGVRRVEKPVLFGVLTTIVAFLPLAFIDGRQGTIFAHIAWVVILCLVFSLIHAKWILPLQLEDVDSASQRWWDRLQMKLSGGVDKCLLSTYRAILGPSLRYPFLTVSIAVSLLILTVGILRGGVVRSVFFPKIEFDQIVAHIETRPGLGFAELVDTVSLAEAALPASGHTRSEVKPNANRIEVIVDKVNTKIRSSEDLVAEWRSELEALPYISAVRFSTNGREPRGEGIRLEIAGSEDPEMLRAASQMVCAEWASYPELSGIDSGFVNGRTEWQYQLTERAQSGGISARMLSAQVRSAVYGGEAIRMQDAIGETRVLVRYPDAQHMTTDMLEHKLRIRSADGRTSYAFADVAKVDKAVVPDRLERQDGVSIYPISAAVDQGQSSAEEVVARMENELLPQLRSAFPELSFSFGGENTERRKSMASLVHALVISLLLIYLLIAIGLNSYSYPLLILVMVPFGLTGAVVGHLLLGVPFSLLSFFGILALGGVVVNDAILLIHTVQSLVQEEGKSWRQAIREACETRLCPVVLTSITTAAALVPILFDQSIQGQYLVPMAISLAFGVLAATVITLVVIPAVLAMKPRTG